MSSGIFVLSVLAMALAWVLASRRAEHRPVALALSIGVAADLGYHAFDAAALAPLRTSLGAGAPWTGWARVAGHVADALVLLWPAALVGAALVVFAGKKPWAALAGWAGAVAWFAVAHPIAGDGSQARALTMAEVLAVLVSAGLGIRWYREAKQVPGSAHFALALIVTAEAVSLFGAWRAGPLSAWPVSQVLYLLLFSLLVVMQGRYLWKPQLSA